MSQFTAEFAETGPDLIESMGETVTYYPSGGDTGRQIKAVIERDPLQSVGEVPGPSIAPRAMLTVLDRQTSISDDGLGGIASTEIDTAVDEIAYAVRVGEEAERRPLGARPKALGGMLRLEVR